MTAIDPLFPAPMYIRFNSAEARQNNTSIRTTFNQTNSNLFSAILSTRSKQLPNSYYLNIDLDNHINNFLQIISTISIH